MQPSNFKFDCSASWHTDGGASSGSRTSIPFKAIAFNSVMWPFLGAFIIAGVFVGILGGLISIGKYLKKEGSIILGW